MNDWKDKECFTAYMPRGRISVLYHNLALGWDGGAVDALGALLADFGALWCAYLQLHFVGNRVFIEASFARSSVRGGKVDAKIYA